MIKFAIRSHYLSLLAFTGLIGFVSSTLKAASPQASALKNTHTTSQQKIVGDYPDFSVKPCITNATGETIEFHYDLLWTTANFYDACRGYDNKVQGPNKNANVTLENNKTICAKDKQDMYLNRCDPDSTEDPPRINIYVCPNGGADCIHVGDRAYVLDPYNPTPNYTIIKGRYKVIPYEIK